MAEKKERDEKGKLLPGHQIRKGSGAWIFLHTLRVPSMRGKRRIQKHLDNLRTRLMEVVPDSSDVRRELVINQIVKTEGFLVLTEEYLKRFGVLDPVAFKQGKMEMQGAMLNVISFLNCQLRAVTALGLDAKEAAEILTPFEIVEKEKGKGKSK